MHYNVVFIFYFVCDMFNKIEKCDNEKYVSMLNLDHNKARRG